MADANVSLEAHDDGAVHRGHHGDLDGGEEPGEGVRVDVVGEPGPQVGQGVQHHAAQHHDQVVHGQDLERKKENTCVVYEFGVVL